jgi:hypothetical protein
MKIFRGRKESKEDEKRQVVRKRGLKLPNSKREEKRRNKKKKKGKGKKEEDEHVVAYI